MRSNARLSLQYHLLSPTNPPPEYVPLHDSAFNSWIAIIQKAFQETNNKDDGQLHEDFIRQDVIGCLTSGEEVVATFLHSFTSICAQATRTFRYLKNNYPEPFFQKLKALGIENVLSVHYLAVNPQWRRGNRDVQVASIMVGLAQRIRDQQNLDAVIGVFRRDRKVHDIAYGLGGDCIISNVMNHQTPCDLIIMNKAKPYQYPSEVVQQQIAGLWNSRIDTRSLNAFTERKSA